MALSLGNSCKSNTAYRPRRCSCITPTLTDAQVKEVCTAILSGAHPRWPDLACAMTTMGGCTKAFADLNQHCKWVLTHKDWKTRFRMKGPNKGTAKRATHQPVICLDDGSKKTSYLGRPLHRMPHINEQDLEVETE